MSAENGNHAVNAQTQPPPGQTTVAAVPTKIKREPGSGALAGMLLTNGGTKLSSFSPARDLTLGGRGALAGAGSAANKKVFLPNLNVVRNKNANVKTSKDTTARGRGRGRGKSERGRGGAARGGGANSSLIQTTGVFSEGAGAVNIRKSSSGGGGGGAFSRNADDAPSAMRRPMIIKREQHKIDYKAEAAQVRELLGDSDDDDFVDEKTDLEQIPIKLNEGKWKYVKTEKPAIKFEDRTVKAENTEKAAMAVDEEDADDNTTAAIVQQIQQMKVQQRGTIGCMSRYPQTVEELLDAKEAQIFVMQLPDTLPCEDDGNDEPEPRKAATDKEPTTDNTPATPTNSPSNSNSLKKMEEGQVGKLLRYKSGKIKLVLGESHFDLDMGMETGFLQDLMSINTNREERSGNMINLGAIQAKLTATPDWEYLLKQQLTLQQQQP